MMKRLILVALAAIAPTVARAQGSVTVGVLDTAVKRVAPGTKFTVPLVVDSSATAATIDSIASFLVWDPGVVTLDSVTVGAFGGFKSLSLNSVPVGRVDFSAKSPASVTPTVNPVSLATVWFTAAQTSGGTRLDTTPNDASLTGTHVAAGQLVGWSTNICVTPSGFWGDANGDGQVDIIDAQQIAKASVGGVVDSAAAVANNGDVNADGVVDILDAQSVARFSVRLPSTPPRINTDRGAIPDVHTLAINHDKVTLAVGSTSSLVATPFDANNFSLVGCQSVAWTSSDERKVHVNPTGQITAIATGSATITATWVSGATTVTTQSLVTVP
jgi:hypothetical protein